MNPPNRQSSQALKTKNAADQLADDQSLIAQFSKILGCDPQHLSDCLDDVDEDVELLKRFRYLGELTTHSKEVLELLKRKGFEL